MKRYFYIILLLVLLLPSSTVQAAEATLKFPYTLNNKTQQEVLTGVNTPMYVAVEKRKGVATTYAVQLILPWGASLGKNDGWQSSSTAEGLVLNKTVSLQEGYDAWFDLLYVQFDESLPLGENAITMHITAPQEQKNIKIAFNHQANTVQVDEQGAKQKKWYINRVILPVNSQGVHDDRTAGNTVYIKDADAEGLRSKLAGGNVNWSSFYNTPATYLLLDISNPFLNHKTLKLDTTLLDQRNKASLGGVSTVSKDELTAGNNTLSLSLDGKRSNVFIIPLYLDPMRVLDGQYSLRLSIADELGTQIQDVPLQIVKERKNLLYVLGFTALCLVTLVVGVSKLKNIVGMWGAKSAITIALFAAVAFGGIVVPTTVLGDVLHVVLGPFSGFVSGLLTQLLLYLLIMSLLVICPYPGVVTMMLGLKWLLGAMVFGRVSPVGLSITAVNIVVLELMLRLSGFYLIERFNWRKALGVAVVLGVGDAVGTYVNMELLMFFFRLYYADWYIALLVLVNGFSYTVVGSYLGIKIGGKLRQVTGE